MLALPATGAAASPGVAAPAGGLSTPVPPAASATGPAGTAVTLVTGDRVLLTSDGDRLTATVEPAERPDHEPVFETVVADTGGDEQLYVFPSDAVPLLGEVLDRELFNISKLVEYGYTSGVPVIITGPGSAPVGAADAAGTGPAGRSVASAGLARARALPSVAGAAATVAPDGTWWTATAARTGAATRAGSASSGAAKVWLDELAEVALDDSVPLVGAPGAWDAGFDGTGLTVAVLDTGIDGDHPDLAGKVVQAENFTEEPDGSDQHGHGTHVAGIIAGSGATSEGTYTGVAPGAELLSGKICDANGNCPQSAIIAGMEWAAARADVVNMSVGTTSGSDGTDPMSQAVDALTAEHDTLFVISAGNSGFLGDGSVGSPGAADAALTVGSVDKDEELADTSSRGPRLGDFAIKPDLTAPGVAIASARADGTSLGSPIDDFYTVASGTSMAAPHVAGAAAILLQQAPGTGAAELKAALAGTAVPHDELDVYQQGGGRLDIPAALAAPVMATPAPVDLGYFPYPHDRAQPVGAEVTYTNRTGQAVTLDLSLAVTSRAGDPAPEEVLSVTPDTLVVEPGQTATATVTVDVSQGSRPGLYGGYLTAEAGGEVATRTPVGFYQEPERYDLTVTGIASDGRPARGSSSFHVLDVHDTSRFLQTGNTFVDGTATLRVPPGTYHVMGVLYRYDGHDQFFQDRVLAGSPEVEVTGDTSVVLDAREGNPLVIDTPAHDGAAPFGQSRVAFHRAAAEQGSFTASWSGDWLPVAAAPTDPVSIGEFEFYTRTRLGDPPLVVSVTQPHQQQLRARPMSGSPPLDESLSLPVVWAGHGAPEDYDGLDASGAAVLTLRGGPGHADKERTAREHGAAALLVANDAVGNYTGSVGDEARIPAMTLPGEEGDLLRDLLDRDQVTLSVSGTPVTPYLYEVLFPEPDRIPAELHYVADPATLATLDNSFHLGVSGHEMGEVRHSWRPYEVLSVGVVSVLPAPQQRTELLVADDTRYRQGIDAARPFIGTMNEITTSYQPGEHREQHWFRSPVRPGVLEGGPLQAGVPAVRDGDTLQFQLPEWVDGTPGHYGWFSGGIDTSAFRLYQDGELIATADRPQGEYAVGPEPAEYRLEAEVARDAPWWTTSVATRTAWTVQSSRPVGEEPEPLPMLLVDYDVDLDLSNTVPQAFRHTFDLQVRHQAAVDDPPAVHRVRVFASYDDGQTWRHRPALPRGDGRFTVLMPPFPPAGADAVSLRVQATDRAGNGIEQEVLRAWQLP